MVEEKGVRPEDKAEDPAAIPPEILKFRWDLNAECNFEEATGHAITDDEGGLRVNLKKSTDLRILLFAGLKSNVPRIVRLDDVGGFVTEDNAEAVWMFVFKAMHLRSKVKKADESPKPEGPATG